VTVSRCCSSPCVMRMVSLSVSAVNLLSANSSVSLSNKCDDYIENKTIMFSLWTRVCVCVRVLPWCG
jgi:hypothetical protein